MDYANYLLLPAQPISTTLISARIECTPHVLNCSSHSENECWVFFFIRFTRRYSRKNKINGKPIVKIRLHFSSCEWAPHIGGESIKCRQRIYAFFPLAIPRIDEYKRNQVSQSTAHPLLPPPPHMTVLRPNQQTSQRLVSDRLPVLCGILAGRYVGSHLG